MFVFHIARFHRFINLRNPSAVLCDPLLQDSPQANHFGPFYFDKLLKKFLNVFSIGKHYYILLSEIS